MAYNFFQFKNRTAEIEVWLGKELLGLRTGRAAPAVLDGVMVEIYGVKQPLKHLATISAEDAKTLRLTPWDRNQIKAIESAVAAANLGLAATADGVSLRISFPDLTTERRQALIKVVKEKLEEARVSLRKERERIWNEIVEMEKTGRLSEDDKFRGKDELQKLIDDSNRRLELAAEKKSSELLN